MNIKHVEIRISSNQSPSRIARAVSDELCRLARGTRPSVWARAWRWMKGVFGS